MSSRELILARVRRNQPSWRELPAVPGFDRPMDDPLAAFGAALARMGGTLVDAEPAKPLDAVIRALFPDAQVICSAVPEAEGTRRIDAVHHPAELDDVDVGIVRAVFGVAETGSVWLSEHEFVVNALGFLAQHLVVLLDPKAIVPNLHHAYRHRGFVDARYAVLMTGPSATADIEGVLIRGAQGVRSFTVVPIAAGPGLPGFEPRAEA
ncbi:MAG: LUD domain-containing protein [Caldimonas sp.]